MLLAIFCLLFIVIGGVSASDVVDMSNNPDNNNLVSDSTDLTSDESSGNYYTNQLSNEGGSSSDSISLDASTDLKSEDNSNIKSDSTLSSSSSDADTVSSTGNDEIKNNKNDTALSISNKNVYSGTDLVVTLKDKNGNLLKGKAVEFNIAGLNKIYTRRNEEKRYYYINYNNDANTMVVTEVIYNK